MVLSLETFLGHINIAKVLRSPAKKMLFGLNQHFFSGGGEALGAPMEPMEPWQGLLEGSELERETCQGYAYWLISMTCDYVADFD